MSAKTSIEWTDATWSPIRYRVRADAAAIARERGYNSLVPIAEKMTRYVPFAGSVGQFCEHVSPGCENCYSEAMQARCLPHNGTGLPFDRRSRDLVEPFIDEEVLREPLRWRKPKRIFVENQSDLFGEWVPDKMIDLVFAVMSQSPEHTFQVLTKRPARMRSYFCEDADYERSREDHVDEAGELLGWCHSNAVGRWPLPNVWLGVSVEDQRRAEERIPDLLATPAAVRFLSCEPLLGPVDLARYLRVERRLDWVIVGGESGRGARPMHPDWARSIRNQCLSAGVPFFFKQWGAWRPWADAPGNPQPNSRDRLLRFDGSVSKITGASMGPVDEIYIMPNRSDDRLLDGREWSEFPDLRS